MQKCAVRCEIAYRTGGSIKGYRRSVEGEVNH